MVATSKSQLSADERVAVRVNFVEIGSSTVIRVDVRLVLQEEKTLNAGAWEPWLQVHSCDLDVQPQQQQNG